MPDSRFGILITRTALHEAATAGAAALPMETGGILLGFRTPDLVVVTRTVTVPDPRSNSRSYLRRREPAQALLNAAPMPAQDLQVVGYVGEWHTHPADSPPSRTDIQALGDTARLLDAPAALIVLTYTQAGHLANVHGLIALRDPWPIRVISPVTVNAVTPTVTDDSTTTLEAEAAHTLRAGKGADRP
ncbi:Mov34/MPN/PAD-1 family protein [Kineococcus aurantiacus]|uniref:Integrative and conjugative element protein (TIGR02256 family) n=1 Tax=Kineococcus aurantiacus TaxID=37633 RepID=A0A7Y9DQM2_9ACTN|nr:Mov34/MPN/PAD-1 family protein [Kineococcus aurantiacus]NYD25020.1 integrative and conjugative element protein (TIGR02256 family) [Kineococcus aurantiacus]